jgi:PKD repeat protein
MVKRGERRLSKRVVAAFLMCTIMVLVAAVPLVGADTHHVVRGSQGPRASAATWTFAPTDYGTWQGHVVNSGLRSIVVDVNDITTGAASSILHQRIRFAEAGNDVITSGATMARNHVYSITVTPSGPKGSSCTVDDLFGIPPPPPVALFTLTASGMTVFADGSTSYDPSPGATIEAWGWEWGDGTTSGPSVIPTATHTYPSWGTYVIQLTVLSSTGMTSSVSQLIHFWPPPPVTFTCAVNGLTVMVDASANPEYTCISYDWNWGDGSTGTGVTATHTYAAPGTYNITLTVMDTMGHSYSVSKAVRVGGGMPPVMEFTYTVGGYVVTVDASSSTDDIGIVSYAWDWGDGTTGTGTIATHTYTAAGPYLVTLTLTDTIGQTSSISRYVLGGSSLSPIAAFTATVRSNGYTVAVNGMNSTGTGGIVSYSWNWGDMTTQTGVTATHYYMPNGVFTITLTVKDSLGQTNSVSREVIVTGTPVVPAVLLVYGRTWASDGVTPLAGCTITITDVRTGTTLIGTVSGTDGTYWGDISPLFPNTGDTIIVNAIGPAGQTGSGTGVLGTNPYLAIDVTLSVMDRPPVAAFALTASATVDFDASASTDDKGIVSYAWDFGDGTTGTGVTITHIYAVPPVTFSVLLTGVDTVGQIGAVSHLVSLIDHLKSPLAQFTMAVSIYRVVTPPDVLEIVVVQVDASTSSDSNGWIVSYFWDFGDGTTGSGVTAEHTYATFDLTRSVTLTVTDNDGLTDSMTKSLT